MTMLFKHNQFSYLYYKFLINVVDCVTDGAAVMVKFGKYIVCGHKLCYAHGIHLAVCDVLHEKMRQ